MSYQSRLQVLHWAQSGKCHICGSDVPEPGSVWPYCDDAPTADHIIPKSMRKKGAPGFGNYLLAHRACNLARGSSKPTVKMIALGQLVHAASRTRTLITQGVTA